MKRLLSITALVILLLVPYQARAQNQPIDVPEVPPPILDGVIGEGEWTTDIPLGALPLRAWALHDGEAPYLAFEVTPPAEEWETFAVWDDGDGEIYEGGDVMLLCTPGGCQSCAYSALYTYDCADELLPSGVAEYVAEAAWDVPLAPGTMVVGGVLDGVEYASAPFDVRFVDLAATEEATAPPEAQPIAATDEPGAEEELDIDVEEDDEEEPLSPFTILWIALVAAVALASAFYALWWFLIREALKRAAIRQIERRKKWLDQHHEQRAQGLAKMKQYGVRGRNVDDMEQEVKGLDNACRNMQDILDEARRKAAACDLAAAREGAGKAAKVLRDLGLSGRYGIGTGIGATHLARNLATKASEAKGKANRAADRAARAERAGNARAADQAAQEAEEQAAKAEAQAEQARQATRAAEEAAKKAEEAAAAEKDPEKARVARNQAARARRHAEEAAKPAARAADYAQRAHAAAQRARAAAQRAQAAAQSARER